MIYLVTVTVEVEADDVQEAADKGVDLLDIEGQGTLFVEVDDGLDVHTRSVDLS